MDRLEDIVVPSPIPWWPPAPGWYVLGTIVVLALLVALVVRIRRYRANAYRRAALRELKELERTNDWDQLPVLLKRTALAAYPREAVASLSGEEWLRFLDRTARGGSFSQTPGKQLLLLAYGGAEKLNAPVAKELVVMARRWIRQHSTSAPSPLPSVPSCNLPPSPSVF